MQKSCKNPWCNSAYDVTENDLAFYDAISPTFDDKKYPVPPPTLCPDCRFQRRMTWRREHALKRRQCNLCERSIVSMHTPDTPYPVYCVKCWWSDRWDPRAYGRDVDLDRPFLEQFAELQNAVPQITMMNDNGVGSENCEYCHDFAFSKNCYLCTGVWEAEECYYCDCNTVRSKFLVDCYALGFSELAYESLSSERLYRCTHMNHCASSSDCQFGIDLKGCKHCIACYGLRQKEYCMWNEQYSKEEYEKKVQEAALDTYEGMTEMRDRFLKWASQFPHRESYQVNCEDCVGHDLFQCKSVEHAFQFTGAEYCKYIVQGDRTKNCYDISQNGMGEWCYEGCTPDNSYMTHFTTWCWKDRYVLYSDNCHSSEHLFGCISMKRAKYCILNKQYTEEQYTEEQYNALVPRIIERMGQDGEWGEFFPMLMSPYCYNETAAQENFPLEKEKVLALNLRWRDEDRKSYAAQTYSVPSRIGDVQDDILQHELSCKRCERNFKILPQELAFYRDMKIPVPRTCYECRYVVRIKERNPRKLWKRECGKCSKEIQTSYSQDRPETIYCDECYLKEVY